MPGGGAGGFFAGDDASSETRVRQVLSPEQRRLLRATEPTLADFARNPPVPFPGDRVAGFDPLQLLAQSLGVGAATGEVAASSQAANEALRFILGPGLDPTTNPNLQAAITAGTTPIFEGLTQSVLPSIRGEAVTSGQFGSSRQGIAEGLAAQSANRVAGEVAADIANRGFLGSLDAASRALLTAPQTAQLGLAPSAAIDAIGATRQFQQQAEINAAVQRFMEEQLFPFLAAREVTGLALGLPGGGANTSQFDVPGGSKDPFDPLGIDPSGLGNLILGR